MLAHEVAHLARRDAAVMEICSAPSRVLLAFAGLTPGLARFTRELVRSGLSPGFTGGAWFFAVLCVPPVGTRRSRLGRLFSTHPPTAIRVKRLEAIEGRLQAHR